MVFCVIAPAGCTCMCVSFSLSPSREVSSSGAIGCQDARIGEHFMPTCVHTYFQKFVGLGVEGRSRSYDSGAVLA